MNRIFLYYRPLNHQLTYYYLAHLIPPPMSNAKSSFSRCAESIARLKNSALETCALATPVPPIINIEWWS